LKVQQVRIRSAASEPAPIETITGETPDMSEFMDFDLYQWIKFSEQTDKNNTKVGSIKGKWQNNCKINYTTATSLSGKR
jgi:hypothetical protein